MSVCVTYVFLCLPSRIQFHSPQSSRAVAESNQQVRVHVLVALSSARPAILGAAGARQQALEWALERALEMEWARRRRRL